VPFLFQLYGAVFNTLGADPAKELALDTGRWALRFLLLSLAVTPVRELSGLAQVAPLRRTLGLFSLFYASLHLLVYALFLLELRWFEIGDDILERPYITVGFTAWLILVALGATSPKRMVRLLGRRWRTLHKLVYLASVLALLHLIWIIRSDISQAVFYGTILIVLLSYRILNHFKKRAAKAQKNRI
jgi:sulfoxide reductase heme-binding subunit YedZ